MKYQTTCLARGALKVARMTCAILVTLLFLAMALTPHTALAMRSDEYFAKSDAFVADPRWANGVSWGQRPPKLSSYGSAGCFAYACDFTTYMYGIENYENGQVYYSVNEIRTGDVIRVEGHSIVILERIGNNLRTAEGAWVGDQVRVANPGYTISGGVILDPWGTVRPFVRGYHFDTGGATTRDVAVQTVRANTDEATGGIGTVTVRGWGYDTDDPSASIAVHVYIGGPAGTDSAEVHVLKTDQNRPDVNKAFGISGNHGFSATFNTNKRGEQPIFIYGIDLSGKGPNPLICNRKININSDTEPPVISNLTAQRLGTTTYRIDCDISDNLGQIVHISLPTWNNTTGRGEDAKWYDITDSLKSNGHLSYVVDTQVLETGGGESATYVSDIYVFDADDNRASARVVMDMSFDESMTDMHRLYNPHSGEHFYTASVGERDALVKLGWKSEGVGWIAPDLSDVPVFRLYNKYGGEHHYTTSESERDTLVAGGWTDEGIGWYSAGEDGVPLYRQYNPHAVSCNHNYTLSTGERDALVGLGWEDEGVGWYGLV